MTLFYDKSLSGKQVAPGTEKQRHSVWKSTGMAGITALHYGNTEISFEQGRKISGHSWKDKHAAPAGYSGTFYLTVDNYLSGIGGETETQVTTLR